jgi:hypothetical protein
MSFHKQLKPVQQLDVDTVYPIMVEGLEHYR